ncbi:MAG: hypothetical protein RL528_187 [Bacteroidota bacterium]|jgi:hypothetical protein
MRSVLHEALKKGIKFEEITGMCSGIYEKKVVDGEESDEDDEDEEEEIKKNNIEEENESDVDEEEDEDKNREKGKKVVSKEDKLTKVKCHFKNL